MRQTLFFSFVPSLFSPLSFETTNIVYTVYNPSPNPKQQRNIQILFISIFLSVYVFGDGISVQTEFVLWIAAFGLWAMGSILAVTAVSTADSVQRIF